LGSFGFIPSKTKTDNFKVVNPAAPDSDGDGIPDSDDHCPTDPLKNSTPDGKESTLRAKKGNS
jgi:hypothetical protein